MTGYVYLIGTPIFGWYKIGKSKSPEVRIKNLGILLPFKIKVIGVWKAENHTLMEQTLHEMYRDHKINGEWFEFNKKEVVNIADSIPPASRVYPASGTLQEELDKFSNVDEDKKCSKRVIGLRVQKLRGDFSPEEREQKRNEAIEKQRIKKLLRQQNTE
jgi:hypothetical protein